MVLYGGFLKLGVPSWGFSPIIRIVVFWALYWGPVTILWQTTRTRYLLQVQSAGDPRDMEVCCKISVNQQFSVTWSQVEANSYCRCGVIWVSTFVVSRIEGEITSVEMGGGSAEAVGMLMSLGYRCMRIDNFFCLANAMCGVQDLPCTTSSLMT